MEDLKHTLIVVCSSAAGMTALAFGAATLLSSAPEHAQAAARESRAQVEAAPAAVLRPAPVAEREPKSAAGEVTSHVAGASLGSVPPPAAAASVPAPALGGRRSNHSWQRESFVGVLLPEQAADVSAQQAGLVREVHVALGQIVERGQVLVSLAVEQATLDHARAEAEREAARAALARARIEHAHAADETQRGERLALEGLITHEGLAQARFELRQTRVLASEAEARLRERSARAEQLAELRDQGSVVASFRGRVAARYVSSGTLVAAGTPLVRVIGDEAVLLRFAVPEYVTGLSAGSRVTVVPNEQPDLSFEARVVRVSPEIDAASRMRTFEAAPDEPLALVTRGLVGAIVAVRPSDSKPLLTARAGGAR